MCRSNNMYMHIESQIKKAPSSEWCGLLVRDAGYVTAGCGSECSHLIGAAQVEVKAAELHRQVWLPPNSLPSEKVDCHFLCDWAEWKCWRIQMTLPEPHYWFSFSRIRTFSCDCCAVNITGRLMSQTLQPQAHCRVRCHICSAKKKKRAFFHEED